MVRTVMIMLLALPATAWAHGYAGKRIFPTTFEVDDPFVMDEFSVLATYAKESGPEASQAMRTTTLSADYTARILEHWGVTVGGEFRRVEPVGENAMHGFGGLLLGTKYQFFTSNAHETIASIGLDAVVGNTGDPRLGTEDFSILSPMLFWGKGLGDLPARVKYARPLALTGTVGAAFPTKSRTTVPLDRWGTPAANGDNRNPTTLVWGITVQYSLAYLQSYVEEVGLARPFNQMVPVVEFAMESCLNAGCRGQTTGSVNPGLIWFGKYVQFGIAARIPVNSRSGSQVGVMGLFHLFVDDLLEDHDHEDKRFHPRLGLAD